MGKHLSAGLVCLALLPTLACGRTELAGLTPPDQASEGATTPPVGADGGTGPCSTSFEPRVIGRSEPPLGERSNGWLALGPEGAYFVERDPSDGAERLMLLRSSDGQTVEQARASRMRLIDADEGKVVTVEQDFDGRVPSIVLRRFGEDSEQRIPSMDLEPYPAFPTDVLAPTQLIDDGRVAIETMSYLGVQALDGSASYETLSFGRSVEPLVLRWPYLLHTSGETLTICDVSQSWYCTQWDGFGVGQGYRQLGIMQSEWIGVLGNQAIRGPLPPSNQGVWEPVSDRPCFSAHTDGRRAVFACDSGSAPTGWPLDQGRTLLVYDGSTVETYDLGDERATFPRISGRFVAYLSYPPGADFCRPSDRGELVVRDLERGERRVLASVAHGCLCCGAYWPVPNLVFEEDLLAWSYDVPDASMRLVGGIGIGRVGPPCD